MRRLGSMRCLGWVCVLHAVCMGAACAEEGAASKPATLTIEQTKVGNLFVGDEPAAFVIRAATNQAAWQVRDFWGRTMQQGTLPIENGAGRLVLTLPARGYFALAISAGTERIETTLAVFSPFDVKSVKESPFGVQTHFAQGDPPEVMEVVAIGGIKSIRDELYWSTVESKKGEYAFMPAYWYMEYARRAGIRPLICLSYANRFYDDNNAPVSPEGLQAYADYGLAVVDTYGPILEGVEVWNEYNCGVGTRKTGNKPDTYLPMLQRTYRTIKAKHPEACVVGVGMSCLIWSWIDRLLGLGALADMDGLSVHPYRWDRWNETPETLDRDMDELRNIIERHNKTGRRVPIWSTEVSWPSMPKWSITGEKQAEYLVRCYAVLWSKGVPKNYWYKLVCDLDDGIDSEFGIVRHWADPRGRLTPKPAFVALGVMTRHLSDWTFVEREKTSPGVWSLRFAQGDELQRVMWALQPTQVTIAVDGPIVITDMMGDSQTVQGENGEIPLTLNGTPIYVTGAVQSIRDEAKFSMTTRQRIAVGDPIALTCLAGAGVCDAVEIEGRTTVIAGDGAAKTIELGQATTAGTRTIVYRLRSRDRVAGYGSVTIEVMAGVELRSAQIKEKGSLEAVIVNHSVDRAVTLKSVRWTIGEQQGEAAVERTIKAASSAPIAVAIPVLEFYHIAPATLRFEFVGGSVIELARSVSFSPCMKQSGPAGDPLRFIDLAKFATVKVKDYGGPADVSGRVWLGWDETNFYMTAETDDDRFHQAYPTEAFWEGDSIQFGVASDTDTRYEFGVALTDKGVHAECPAYPPATNPDSVVAGARFSVQRDGTTVVYRCVIPWSQIPPIRPANGTMLFSILVNDNDGGGRKGWIEWGGGIGDSKSVERYQTCTFVGE
jgi:hypothetical protein